MSIIIKGGSSGDLATVKSASTAPVATDPALVVSLSPNSSTSATVTANQGTANTIGNAWPTKITDGTSTNTLKATTVGAVGSDTAIVVDSRPGLIQTYSAAILGLVPAATPTDIFTITGSASKTIRVTKLTFSGTKTTAGLQDAQFVKRSTANSAGTSTSPTRVPHDSTNAAATATVLAYTANPTTGTLVGAVRVVKILYPAPAGTTNAISEFIFGDQRQQSFVLRGTSEVLALNLNSVTVTGGSIDAYVEWTEE
jgi:hypothetical protein